MINNTKVETIVKVADSLKEEIEYLITYVKLIIILFVFVITKIILTKTVTICKKVYSVHKERVIRKHGATQQI